LVAALSGHCCTIYVYSAGLKYGGLRFTGVDEIGGRIVALKWVYGRTSGKFEKDKTITKV
jgi:hypothetical protein